MDHLLNILVAAAQLFLQHFRLCSELLSNLLVSPLQLCFIILNSLQFCNKNLIFFHLLIAQGQRLQLRNLILQRFIQYLKIRDLTFFLIELRIELVYDILVLTFALSMLLLHFLHLTLPIL